MPWMPPSPMPPPPSNPHHKTSCVPACAHRRRPRRQLPGRARPTITPCLGCSRRAQRTRWAHVVLSWGSVCMWFEFEGIAHVQVLDVALGPTKCDMLSVPQTAPCCPGQLCYVFLSPAVLCRAKLCCTMLSCAVLCPAVSSSSVFHHAALCRALSRCSPFAVFLGLQVRKAYRKAALKHHPDKATTVCHFSTCVGGGGWLGRSAGGRVTKGDKGCREGNPGRGVTTRKGER